MTVVRKEIKGFIKDSISRKEESLSDIISELAEEWLVKGLFGFTFVAWA